MCNRAGFLNQQNGAHTDLHRQVVAIFADVFQVDIDPSIENLAQQELEQWDSFNHLRLVSELEEIFQIMLSDEEIPELTTLQRVETLLAQRGIAPSSDINS
jgi:acyl carrier protein